MEGDNFDKLTMEELCAHKNWRARINGYSTALQEIGDIADDKSDEWNKYVSIAKGIIRENNDLALEKGLETVLSLILNSPVASKIVGFVSEGLVKKCVASARIRTREFAMQICMACVEIGRGSLIADELLKGTESKNPKTSAGCVRILTEIISAFGPVLPTERVFQRIPFLLEDRDQNVRNEAKSLTIELHRWLAEEMRSKLLKPDILKAPKLAEIVSAIEKLKNRPAEPKRFLRTNKKHPSSDMSDLSSRSTVHSISEEPPMEESLDDSNRIDILGRIPESFYIGIKSSKWLERKESLEALLQTLFTEGRFQNGDFSEIVHLLVGRFSKDPNTAVVCLSVKCVTQLALRLRMDFAPYSAMVFRALLEKLKEKKLTVVQTLREAMDAVLKFSSFNAFIDDMVETLKNKNPNVRGEGAFFLSRCFSQMSRSSLDKKPLQFLFSNLVVCLSDQDSNVRNQSSKALGVAMGIMGEKYFSSLFKDLDKIKLSKIKDCALLFLEETKGSKCASTVNQKCSEIVTVDSKAAVKKVLTVSSKPLDVPLKTKKNVNASFRSPIKPKDKTAEIASEQTVRLLSDKEWFNRVHAISCIQKAVDSATNISADLGELGVLLSLRIVESNPKISTASINLVTSLAKKIGPPFRAQWMILLPGMLKAVGDVKKPVRDAAVNGLTEICFCCGYGEVFEDEMLPESLKSGSNTVKVHLWRWVSDNCTAKGFPGAYLENILPILFAALEDRNPEVRNAASNAVGSILKVLTLEKVIDICSRCYENPNCVMKIILDKQKCGLTAQCTDAISKPLSKPKTNKLQHSKRANSDDEKKPFLLDANDLKNQRVNDDNKRKTAKWDFDAPRTEFVDLLKGLMSAANFSEELTKLMFHSDFRRNLTAMDLLLDEISRNSVGIVCNLDLILRWLTLKFFDGNPTVLSRSLDFALTALAKLSEINYCLLDSEAIAFVPYLVMKLGDSKENIQTKLKQLLTNLTSVHPVSKLKNFVIDGTRSNIARQRANSLDVIISYVKTYGKAVYAKEIDSVSESVGRLLRDRDPGVKKKAFIVAGLLYDLEGEKVIELMGKNAGEDFKMIEHKIRKYIVSTENDSELIEQIPSKHDLTTVQTSLEVEHVVDIEPETIVKPCQKRTFQWDDAYVQEIDKLATISGEAEDIVDIGLEFLSDNDSEKSPGMMSSYSTNTAHLNRVVESIADNDPVSSNNSVKYISMILYSGQKAELEVYAVNLIQKLSQNLENLSGKRSKEVLENYDSTLSLIITVSEEKTFIRQFSKERLYETLFQLLSIISDYKFSGKENETYLKKTNTAILKILENANKTALVCALVEMLGGTRDKVNELCMKCLWKLNRAQPAWDGELDYAAIFSVIRPFLGRYPVPWWKSNRNDMPMRTVKTILKTMVILRGSSVLSDVSEDDDFELRWYLSKLMKRTPCGFQEDKRTKLTNINEPGGGTITTVEGLTRSQAKELADIFRNIATNTPEGIAKLNEFTNRNPSVDLHRILIVVSPGFYNYYLTVIGKTMANNGGVTTEANTAEDVNLSEEIGRMWIKLNGLREEINNFKICGRAIVS